MRGLGLAAAAGLLAPGLGACAIDVGGFAFMNDKAVTAHAGTSEPVLGLDGRCTAEAGLDPSALRGRPSQVAPGISECDLVRLKGQPADVLIGGSGKGQREVQVLYQEPAGKRLYLFSDNRLARVVE